MDIKLFRPYYGIQIRFRLCPEATDQGIRVVQERKRFELFKGLILYEVGQWNVPMREFSGPSGLDIFREDLNYILASAGHAYLIISVEYRNIMALCHFLEVQSAIKILGVQFSSSRYTVPHGTVSFACFHTLPSR